MDRPSLPKRMLPSLPRTPSRSPFPRRNAPPPISFRDWDPSSPPTPSPLPPHPPSTSAHARSLSPLARFVLDALRRNNLRWGTPVLSALSQLRRVPPSLLSELLRSPLLPPHLSSPLFLWASRQKGFRPSYSSFNSLALSLLRSPSLFRSADLLPDLMLRLRTPPTEKQFDLLLRSHAAARRGLRLHRLYTRMIREFSIVPRVQLYHRILHALVRSGHLDLALEVYKDFRDAGHKEEKITFMILIRGLCLFRKIDDAVALLERMRNECCKPDVFAYTALAKATASSGSVDGCLKLWEEARKDGVRMDAMAYTTMITVLCRNGLVGDAWGMFDEMRRNGVLVDRAVYAMLVEGFIKKGSVGRGCEIFSEMVKDGYRADLGIYDALIAGLCNASREDKAAKLFRVAVQEGLVPGVRTVCPLLVKYAEKGEMELLFGMLGRIENLALPVVDCVAAFLMLFMDGSEEKARKGMEVFVALKGKGYCGVSIYNAVIESLYKAEMFSQALELFEEISSSEAFEPDCSTYCSIIPCFVESGDVKGAFLCYVKMKEKSWIPSVDAYCSLVKGLCGISEINAAIMVVKDCLGNVENGPMDFKYALTVLNACKSGNAEKVIEVLNELIEESSRAPKEIIYCAIIQGFCKYSSMKEAKKVFADLRNRDILTETKFIMYEDMLKAHLMRTTAGLVMSGLKFFGLESQMKLTSPLEYSK